MFCKNCGSAVKDGIRFCPKCGNATAGNESRNGGASGAGGEFGFAWEGNGRESFGYTGTGNAVGTPGAGAVQKKANGGKKLLVIIAAVAVVAAVLFAVWRHNANKKYSIVGEWVSAGSVDMGVLIDAILEENDISGLWAETFRTALGSWYGVTDNLAFVFYDRGEFGITLGGVGVSVLDTTYELMPNGKLNLNFGFAGILKQIPIKGLSFNVKCKVGKDTMTMEMFGSKFEFQRKN